MSSTLALAWSVLSLLLSLPMTGCQCAAARQPWPGPYAALVDFADQHSKQEMRSGGPWQVARCTILAIKVVEMGPENAWVDAADLQSASWVQLRVEENLSPHSFVVPGTRFWAVHDPAYTRRAHGLATPDHGWMVGETRFTILQHIVGLGIVWKGTRLMVMGPLCDPKDGQPPSR